MTCTMKWYKIHQIFIISDDWVLKNQIFIIFVNVEICRLPWWVHWKLAMVKGIPRYCSAKKLRETTHASRNIESYRRECRIDGSTRWTIADTTCACQQHQSTRIQENRSQLLYVHIAISFSFLLYFDSFKWDNLLLADMSLCHFKICNMGRKRNTRYLHL